MKVRIIKVSNAITMAEKKVAKIKSDIYAIMHDPDGTYRMSCFAQEELATKRAQLQLAEAQLWALRKAQENAKVMPQSGYRLAYVAG